MSLQSRIARDINYMRKKSGHIMEAYQACTCLIYALVLKIMIG